MYVPCFSAQEFTNAETELCFDDYCPNIRIDTDIQEVNLCQIANTREPLNYDQTGIYYNQTKCFKKRKSRKKCKSNKVEDISFRLLYREVVKCMYNTHCQRKCPQIKKRRLECSLRIAELSVPTKRHCLDTWKNKGHTLPNYMVNNLKQLVCDEVPIVKISDAICCFKACKKRKIRCKKYMKMCDKTIAICAVFGYKIKEMLLLPTNCNDLNSRNLFEIIYEEITNILHKGKKHKDRIKFTVLQIEIANRITDWIEVILEETTTRLIMEDISELEEKEGHVWVIIDEVIEIVMELIKTKESRETSSEESTSSYQSENDNDNNSDVVSVDIIIENVTIEDYIKSTIIITIIDNAETLIHKTNEDPNSESYGSDSDENVDNNINIDSIISNIIVHIKDIEQDSDRSENGDDNINNDSSISKVIVQINDSQQDSDSTENVDVNINNDSSISNVIVEINDSDRAENGDDNTNNDTSISKVIVQINDSHQDSDSTENVDDNINNNSSISNVIVQINDSDRAENGDDNTNNDTSISKVIVQINDSKQDTDSTANVDDNINKDSSISNVIVQINDLQQDTDSTENIDDNINNDTSKSNVVVHIKDTEHDSDRSESTLVVNINNDTALPSHENQNAETVHENIAEEKDVHKTDVGSNSVIENQDDSNNADIGKAIVSIKDTPDDSHSADSNEQSNVTHEVLDNGLKKVKFSDIAIDIINGIMEQSSSGFYNDINIATSHTKLSQDTSNNYLNNKLYRPPNSQLLSKIDEPWIGNLLPPLLKISDSVSKSVTSLGFISETDEISTVSPDTKHERETRTTELTQNGDREYSEELHQVLIMELVNIEKDRARISGTTREEIIQITAEEIEISKMSEKYLQSKNDNNDTNLKVKILPAIDIINKNDTRTKSKQTQTDVNNVISKITRTKLQQHEIRIWCRGLENVILNLGKWSHWMDNSRTYVNYLRRNEMHVHGINTKEYKIKKWAELEENINSDVKTWLKLQKSIVHGLHSYRSYYHHQYNNHDTLTSTQKQSCHCNKAKVIL